MINSVLCGMWELHEQKGELSVRTRLRTAVAATVRMHADVPLCASQGVLRDLAHVASSFRDRAQDAALARR